LPEPSYRGGESIKTPEWVKTQLLEGENVLSKISVGRADWYATDKRFLVFRGKADCQVLEYDKISITFKKFGLRGSIPRFLLTVLSLPLFALGIPGLLFGPYRIPFVEPPTYVRMSRLEGLSIVFMGVLIIIIAFFLIAGGYYQINYPGFGKSDLKKWRLLRTRWGAGKVDRFMKVVQERSGGVHG